MTEAEETIQYLNRVGVQVKTDIWHIPTTDDYVIVSRYEEIFTCGMSWSMGFGMLELLSGLSPLVAAKLAEPLHNPSSTL